MPTKPVKPIAFLGVVLFSVLSLVTPLQAQQMPLSPTATASVITCGPGNDFYTTFGHSAIRVTDTAQGIDLVYNYGTFDFDTPHFYWKFARGRLEYMLGRTTFDRFYAVYNYEQRAVWEQPLNLTQQEVNNLFLMLEWNYQPENRYYLYDILLDNCATRVRDMMEATVGKKTIGYGDWEDHSYRYWLHDAMGGGCLEWWTLGVDMLLGLHADHVCNKSEVMFYPLAMMWLYENAKLDDAEPLVSPTKELLADTRAPLHRSFPPLAVFSLLFVAVALLTWQRLWPRWADRLLFVLAGLLGLFLVFMWVGTAHYCTDWNLNILWASPLLLLIAIRLGRSPRWSLWLQLGMFAVAAVYVVACGLSLAFVPIILMLALRTASLFSNR